MQVPHRFFLAWLMRGTLHHSVSSNSDSKKLQISGSPAHNCVQFLQSPRLFQILVSLFCFTLLAWQFSQARPFCNNHQSRLPFTSSTNDSQFISRKGRRIYSISTSTSTSFFVPYNFFRDDLHFSEVPTLSWYFIVQSHQLHSILLLLSPYR